MSFFNKKQKVKEHNTLLWSEVLDIDNPTKLQRKEQSNKIDVEELKRNTELKVYLRSTYLL